MQSIKKSKKEGIRRKRGIYAWLVALCDKSTYRHSFIPIFYTWSWKIHDLAKQEVMNLILTNLCFNNVMFITLECLSIVNQNVTM